MNYFWNEKTRLEAQIISLTEEELDTPHANELFGNLREINELLAIHAKF